MPEPPAVVARRITVRGIVQGVGFRPSVHRLAVRLGVRGWVLNDVAGVLVHAEGEADAVAALVDRLGRPRELPAAAVVESIDVAEAMPEGADAFVIRGSEEGGRPTTRISPDLCVCDDCLRELRDPADPRHAYPYVNCTECGPRYSIIRSLPYDRDRTTMAAWPLCPRCRAQYEDPADRRFHAQPVACPACGPTYVLEEPAGAAAGDDARDEAGGVAGSRPLARGPAAIAEAARRLAAGAVVGIKGIGGYHLACDATDPAAVAALRERKFRKEKPFALLVSDVATAEDLVELDDVARGLLTSTARPIVLAPARRDLPGVAPGTDELGVMLPCAPMQVMLLEAGAPVPLVLTSGNRSSEPIAYEDDDARTRLAGLADALLVGERPIRRRVDDSVVTVRRGRPFMVRRARGHAPASVARLETPRPVLAVGADLKNAIALAADGEVLLAQHVGDLGELSADRAFRETIEDLLDMRAIDPRGLVVAHDLHPGYVSTRTALELPARRHVGVQHHAAHVAGVLLEHGRPDEPVIGVALDGTGWDPDGTIRGGEILRGTVAGGLERVDGLAPVAMPGGDAAARHPVQAAAAYLTDVDPAVLEGEPFGFPPRFRQAASMVRSGLRCFPSTSCGRLFDAAAAVCGFVREITYEGQAAIRLERLAARGGDGVAAGAEATRLAGAMAAGRPDGGRLDGAAVIRAMVARRREGVPAAVLARAFHEALAAGLAEAVRRAAAGTDVRTVVCSGGVWQNRRLLDAFAARIGVELELRLPERIPVNDGGIAVGQIAIAAAQGDAGADG